MAQTDITNLSGTISAQYSDSPSGEEIGKLVDNLSSTKYLTFNASAWVQFQASESYVVTKYSITSANDAVERDPLKLVILRIKQRNNVVRFLDTRTNEDFATRFLKKEFSFVNTAAYTYYRLQMTNNSGNHSAIGRIRNFWKSCNSGNCLQAL